MIILLLTYLLFEIIYDHWSVDNHTWNVIYFTFQFGWMGALSLFTYVNRKHIAYLFIAIIFTILALDELLGLISNQIQSDMPVFRLTIFAALIFTIYEILTWKKRQSV